MPVSVARVANREKHRKLVIFHFAPTGTGNGNREWELGMGTVTLCVIKNPLNRQRPQLSSKFVVQLERFVNKRFGESQKTFMKKMIVWPGQLGTVCPGALLWPQLTHQCHVDDKSASVARTDHTHTNTQATHTSDTRHAQSKSHFLICLSPFSL